MGLEEWVVKMSAIGIASYHGNHQMAGGESFPRQAIPRCQNKKGTSPPFAGQ